MPSYPQQRKHPRVELRVKARLFMAGDSKRRFEATLFTTNISMGGLFLESTFFLRVGQRLEVELELPRSKDTIRARGSIVHVETMERSGRMKTGFALKFEELFDGSRRALTRYFLGPVLEEFVSQHARQERVRLQPEERDRIVDFLAAWEFRRTSHPEPPTHR